MTTKHFVTRRDIMYTVNGRDVTFEGKLYCTACLKTLGPSIFQSEKIVCPHCDTPLERGVVHYFYRTDEDVLQLLRGIEHAYTPVWDKTV